MITNINKAYRFIRRKYIGVKHRLTRLNFQLIGQIRIDPKATIEPRAIIDLDYKNKTEWAVEIGPKTRIKNDAYLGPRNGFIKIGEGCSINRNCVLLGYGGITLGNNVRIAANSSIIAFNHNFEDASKPIIEQGNRWKGIKLEDDVWLGTGVRILDGVTIGKGAVIGAGSVVTKSIPPLSVAVGTPAKVIKTRQ